MLKMVAALLGYVWMTLILINIYLFYSAIFLEGRWSTFFGGFILGLAVKYMSATLYARDDRRIGLQQLQSFGISPVHADQLYEFMYVNYHLSSFRTFRIHPDFLQEIHRNFVEGGVPAVQTFLIRTEYCSLYS